MRQVTPSTPVASAYWQVPFGHEGTRHGSVASQPAGGDPGLHPGIVVLVVVAGGADVLVVVGGGGNDVLVVVGTGTPPPVHVWVIGTIIAPGPGRPTCGFTSRPATPLTAGTHVAAARTASPFLG